MDRPLIAVAKMPSLQKSQSHEHTKKLVSVWVQGEAKKNLKESLQTRD